MYPTFDEIREMAAAGTYKRIPVCKELYADRMRYGADIPFWDMILPWKLPAQTVP